MVEIFAKTTTTLSSDFVSKIPANVLSLTLDNLHAFVNISLNRGIFTLKGEWQDVLTAYTLLKSCLDAKDAAGISYDDAKGEDIIKPSEELLVKKENEDVVDLASNIDDAETDVKVENNEIKSEAEDEDTEDDTTQDVNLKVVIKKHKYKCKMCNYSGKRENQLTNHMNRVHKRRFKCLECGKKFGFRADLTRHLTDVHTEREKFFCKICNKYLKTKTYIDDHMQLHNDNFVYHCKSCDKSFSTKMMFAKHFKLRHPKLKIDADSLSDLIPDDVKDDSLNPEDDSGTESNTSENKAKPESHNGQNLQNDALSMSLYLEEMETDKTVYEGEHFTISKKKGKNKGRPRIKSFVDERTEFACHLCNYIGKKECHLEYHIKRNHSQKLVCDICDKQFGYNWDLKRHREQVHADASFFCHICSKAYKVKKSFDEHLKSHEDGYVKERFPCTVCEKSFSAKQVLENHMKFKHLGVQQKEKQRYLCQTCGQEFYHKYSYQSHMNKHAGLMPFNCDICGKAFASEHSVKEHQIVHKSQRNHCCAHCPKTFKTSSALKAHEAIHVGERCYKCSVCGKGFVQKQSLMRHERIHSGYKPYKCRLCARLFTDSATVRKHMILVHKKDPHGWQGDVMSDLKRPLEVWRDDEEDPDMKKTRLQVSQSAKTTTPFIPETSDYSTVQSDNQMIATSSASGHLQSSHDDYYSHMSSLSHPVTAAHQSLPQHALHASVINDNHNHDHLSLQPLSRSHMVPPNSAVEMAASGILNLSAHLAPPLATPIGHMTGGLHQMEGQMPQILNLSNMQNMNYQHSSGQHQHHNDSMDN